MARSLIGILTMFGLGVIVGETINNFEWFGQRLIPYRVGLTIAAAYGIAQLVLYKLRTNAEGSQENGSRYKRALGIYHAVMIAACVAVALSIPFIWWGVIKRLAAAASQGTP